MTRGSGIVDRSKDDKDAPVNASHAFSKGEPRSVPSLQVRFSATCDDQRSAHPDRPAFSEYTS